ncbi:uncharacterized protein D12 isoform X2 [Eurosta solidaginis]|uniref:uncharacterized protein D12 isoform X2 n=1 Tax=Eurosta solidaginis TaxID=178769 RepID=UPI00353092C0
MLRHSCHQLELEDSIPETKPKRNFNMLPAFATQYKQKQHDEYYDPDYTKIPCIDHIYKASDYESITTTIAIVFQREMVIKQEQLENLHKRLDRVRILLDRLRFRIVQNHYREQELLISESDAFTVRGKATPYEEELHGHQKGMHPAIKYLVGKTAKKPSKIIGKSLSVRVPAHNALSTICTWSPKQKREERRLKHVIREPGFVINQSKPKSNQLAPYVGGKAQLYNDDPTVFQLGKHGTIPNTVKKNRLERLSKVLNISRLSNKSKHMIVIGNTSTYIRKENLAGTKKKTSADDIMTHKWLVYVKSRNLDSCLESVIKKVRFNIHPSYRPNDVVDISTPPFQITRRGWGEFPIRIELYFHEHFKQKPVQITHNLVLDRKLSGMHTLGAETLMEIFLRTHAPIDQNLFSINSFKPSNIKSVSGISDEKKSSNALNKHCMIPSGDDVLEDNMNELLYNYYEIPSEKTNTKTIELSKAHKSCNWGITKHLNAAFLLLQTQDQLESNSKNGKKLYKKSLSLPWNRITDINTKTLLSGTNFNSEQENYVSIHKPRTQNFKKKGEITLKRERINDAQYDSNFMHFTSPFLMRLSTASHNNNRDEKLGQLRDGECKMKIIQEHEGHTHILTGAHVGRIKSPNWLGKKPMHLMPLSTKSVKYITGSFKNIPKKVAYKEGNTNMILKQSLPSHAKINKAELKSNAGDSQKQVFQKEGKLFIIDPLGKKFKQQRRKQKSLLKPQTFWQRQDKQQPHYESAQSKALESMMSDHDYTPAVVIHALNKSTTSIHPSNDAALITSLNVPRQIQISEYNLPYAERSHDFVPFQQRQIQFEKEFLAQNVVGMRFAVDYMLRRLPLIAAKNILASSFSFVSQSLEDFEALPVMKQRACEWLRAKYVTHFVRSHEYLKELNSTNKEVFWSTREVLIYARYHGFTPKLKLFDSFCALQLQTQTSPRSAIYIQTLKPDLRNTTKVQNLQQKLGFAQHFRKRVKLEQGHYHFDSLTPKYRITSWLDTTHHKLKIDKTNLGCDFEKIDIVNMPKNNIREALICKTIDKIDLNPDQPLDSGLLRFLRISENLSEASILVSDFFRDLFIKLEPELVGSNITYPLVHKVIAHCLKVFVEKLISRTVALKKNAPIGDCLDIAMRDIGKVLVRHSEFDFITTQHFGRYEY